VILLTTGVWGILGLAIFAIDGGPLAIRERRVSQKSGDADGTFLPLTFVAVAEGSVAATEGFVALAEALSPWLKLCRLG